MEIKPNQIFLRQPLHIFLNSPLSFYTSPPASLSRLHGLRARSPVSARNAELPAGERQQRYATAVLRSTDDDAGEDVRPDPTLPRPLRLARTGRLRRRRPSARRRPARQRRVDRRRRQLPLSDSSAATAVSPLPRQVRLLDDEASASAPDVR